MRLVEPEILVNSALLEQINEENGDLAEPGWIGAFRTGLWSPSLDRRGACVVNLERPDGFDVEVLTERTTVVTALPLKRPAREIGWLSCSALGRGRSGSGRSCRSRPHSRM